MKLAIFGQLSNNHLLSCRRVCRSWNRYIGAQFGDRFQVWLEPSRQLFKEQLVDTFERLGTDVLDSRKLIDDEEEEEEGDEEQQRQEQQPHRLHWFGGRLTFWQMANLIDHWDRQLEAMVRLPEVLDGALFAVHSLRIKGGFISYRHLVLLLSHTGPRLRSLRLAMNFERSPTAWKLSAGHHLRLNSLAVLDVSCCPGGLDDRTLLLLTAHTPRLAVFNAGLNHSLLFYPGVHRRFYSCRDEHGEELDEDGLLRLVLRQPTTYGLTFAAVRVMLRYHTPSLTTIHLATRAITIDSVRQLLTDNSSSSSSLTDIYLEGPEECPVSVAKQIRELKQQQQNNKAQTQIHFE